MLPMACAKIASSSTWCQMINIRSEGLPSLVTNAAADAGQMFRYGEFISGRYSPAEMREERPLPLVLKCERDAIRFTG